MSDETILFFVILGFASVSATVALVGFQLKWAIDRLADSCVYEIDRLNDAVVACAQSLLKDKGKNETNANPISE